MNVLVLGKSGQIAHELIHQLRAGGHSVRAISREDCDFAQPQAVAEALEALSAKSIDIVVNGIAYTEVDNAEDAFDQAEAINHHSVQRLADWCAQHSKWLIHYSTDYVFDGSIQTTPFREDNGVAPINAYGLSKFNGEEAIRRSGCRHLILRTSWVFAERGSNFLLTMLKLAQSRNELSVVNDQQGVPNYAADLVTSTLAALEQLKPEHSGTYHLSAQPATTWYEFARAIFSVAGMDIKVNPVSSEAFVTKARRPHYSVLNNSKFCQTFCVQIPDWHDALGRAYARLSADKAE